VDIKTPSGSSISMSSDLTFVTNEQGKRLSDRFSVLLGSIRDFSIVSWATSSSAVSTNSTPLCRKRLVAGRDPTAGIALQAEDLTASRLGTGLPPALMGQIIGRCLRGAVPVGTLIEWDMLA
jgi:sialic acid synthase SpsE